jgi:hypothetical protein
MNAVQLQLPFACLDFPGRATVTLAEIAAKLGGTVQHYFHHIDDGSLVALDLRTHRGSRRMLRVPVDEYRRFVLAKLTSTKRPEFLAELPRETLREIAAEIAARLAA